jgi:hypothetical protein
MRALPLGLMILVFMGIPLRDATSHAHWANGVAMAVLDSQMSSPLVRYLEERKIGLMKELTPNDRVKLVEIHESVPQEAKETPTETESFLIENGPKLIAGGKYNLVLDKIKDIPDKAKNSTQMRTLECFANLMGWVINRDSVCKTKWWTLRTELIKLGDNEATPMLVFFLKDRDPYLRLYAAELLSHIGDKRALEDLREAGENDKNPQVRKNARWAYEQISGKKF